MTSTLACPEFHLLACEHHRDPPRGLGAHDVVHPRQFLAQHLLVEEEQRAQGLVLRRRGHVALDGQRAEEPGDLGGTHPGRMPLVVEQDEAPDPADVGLLGAQAAVSRAQGRAYAVEQAGRRRDRSHGRRLVNALPFDKTWTRRYTIARQRWPELLQRHLEEAAELAREVDRDAGVHGSLLVEEALRPTGAEHTLVPDVRMDVEPVAAVEAKAHEALRRHVVPGQGQRHVERPRVQREEELPAVGVVVRVPEQHPARRLRVPGPRALRRHGVGQDVVPADRLGAPIQDVALPLADEHALGGPALIPRVRVDRAGALRGPPDDLDRALARIGDEMPVVAQALLGGVHHRDRRQREPRRQLRVEVVDRGVHVGSPVWT